MLRQQIKSLKSLERKSKTDLTTSSWKNRPKQGEKLKKLPRNLLMCFTKNTWSWRGKFWHFSQISEKIAKNWENTCNLILTTWCINLLKNSQTWSKNSRNSLILFTKSMFHFWKKSLRNSILVKFSNFHWNKWLQ